jgi:hypothetical protein
MMAKPVGRLRTSLAALPLGGRTVPIAINRPRTLRIGLLWRALRARNAGNARLEQLKNSGRALLFSKMPRMLGDDGSTADTLQHEFRYVEDNAPAVPLITVSARRWKQALATSRAIARRRPGAPSPA